MNSATLRILEQMLESERHYWLEKLRKPPLQTGVPLDFERPVNYAEPDSEINFVFDGSTSAKLLKLCSNNEFLVFAVLVGAVKICVARYTGHEDVIIGTVIHARSREVASLNQVLALRDSVKPGMSLRDLLVNIKQTLSEAYANQKYPFDGLVQELGIANCPNRGVLFDVIATLDQINDSQDIDGLKTDLICHFSMNDGSIGVRVKFSHLLYLPETVQAFCRHLQAILVNVSDSPNTAISRLNLVTEAGGEKFLPGSNQTAKAYPETDIREWLARQAAKYRNEVAVVAGGREISYAQLEAEAETLATRLRECGVREGSRVGILLEHSYELIVGLLGVLKSGAAYVPLAAGQAERRIARVLKDSGVRLVVTQPELKQQLGAEVGKLIRTGAEWSLEETVKTSIGNEEERDPGLVYVMYTSGTTGQPKGVAIGEAALLNYLQWALEQYVRGEQLSFGVCTSIGFDLTVTSIYLPLLSGGRLVLYQPGAEAVAAVLRENQVEVLKLTPSHLLQLAGGEHGGSRLRRLIVGGEALSVQLAERVVSSFGGELELYNEYGPTEATVGCMVHRYEAGVESGPGVSIGRAAANTKIYVLDEGLEPVGENVVGEIYIGGAGLARGYWQAVAQTAAKFVPHPYSRVGGERLYRSGDLGRWRRDGRLEYLGRRDEQVKYQGHRVELQELRAALNEHPEVRESVMRLERDGEAGTGVLVAYYVSLDPLPASELRSWLSERVIKETVPSVYVHLKQLPLGLNGKVNHEALPGLSEWRRQREYGEQASGAAAAGEWTPVEELVAGIWSELLKIATVGRTESFFELGGHSLLAIQMISRVREVFGVQASLRRLFADPTVRGASRNIQEQLRTGEGIVVPPLVKAEREQWDDLLPLSFSQQRLWFLDQLEPGSGFYNLPAAMRLEGRLEIAALEWALSEIVRRHEVLRTQFVSVAGEPRQKVLEATAVNLTVTDLSGLDETSRETAVAEAATIESSKSFDLVHGPLLRTKLLRLSEQEHVVLLTMHHIVSDGWSMGVLIKEITALYDAYSRGEESPLKELPVQYADFAVWQRNWLQGEELERQMAYWRRQLGGELPVLELPTDRPRSAVPGYRGARSRFQLETEVSAGLKELSRREGVTLFMTLLAAFQTLLHRHSGQDEIIVGTPLAGRNYRETEPLIGSFLNTVALRVKLGDEPTFVELVQRVKEVCLGAYVHQDVPFEKLVEELQPERDLSRSPLFQVAFGLQHLSHAEIQLGELRLQPVEVKSETVRYDLTLWMAEGRGGISLQWSYRDELFSAERIRKLQGRFERLLAEVVSRPECRLSQLPLESVAEEAERRAREEERRAVLEEGGAAELVAVEQVEGYELTTQQAEVWEREQQNGETWLWGAVRVSGELEPERLQRAVQDVAEAEEVLRSGFERLAGMEQPLQVVRGASGVMVEVEESAAATVAASLQQWGHGPWSTAEQWAVRLLRVSDVETVLALRLRPLCGDRETVRQVLEAVLAAYERGPGVEPERRVQYADYGAWQKEVLAEAEGEGRAYWEREQRGERSELRLGLERGAAFGGDWRHQRVAVSAAVAEQVRQVAAVEEVSEEAVLLSVWQLLLWRHTEAGMVGVERRASGRGYEELQSALGRYERWLPLRVRVREEASWREWLRETAARLAETEKWQEYYRGGSEAGAGEARIGFEYVSWPGEWAGAELRGEWQWLEERVGGQKLKLRVAQGAELWVELEYETAVLSDEAAAWLSEQYVQLLTAVSAAPEVKVSEAVLVSERERQQVLGGWNAVRLAEAGVRSVVELFELQVAQAPEAVAVISSGEQLSYGELNERANRLAHYLRRQGVGAEVVVGLCVERSVELVVGLLGILKAGGAYLPLDPGYPQQRLAYMLGDAAVQVVLTQQRLLEQLPMSGARAIALDEEWEAIASESGANPAVASAAANLAYVIYTSGSTGQPKGVMISHGNLVQLWRGLQQAVYAGLEQERLRVGWNASLGFDASVKQWLPLLSGHTLYLLGEEERLDSERVLASVREQRLQVLDTTPGQLRTWLAAGLGAATDQEELAAVLVGGEALEGELWRELSAQREDGGAVYYNVYGPTECTVDATCAVVSGERAVLGRRLEHVSVYVLNEQQELAGVGVRGELCLGGGGVGRGYWRQAELTAERFVPHPYSASGGERLYRTGDEGRYLEDGRIEYLGRRDQQVKLRGYRIELGEIEAVLESHSGVRQAVVTVRDERLVGYLVAAREGQLRDSRSSAGEGRGGYEVRAGLRVAQQNKNETDYLYQEIFERRCYLRHGVSIERGDWVVDVGANIGLFSLQAAQLGAARVYAFEPLAEVCASLRQNARLGGGRIRVFEHGLSQQEGAAPFTYYPRYTMMSGQSAYADAAGEVEVIKRYLANEAGGGSATAATLLGQAEELLAGRFEAQEQECRLRRLTDVMREEQLSRIDLLKIDVQRAEWDVLAGIGVEDWQRIGQIVLEVHDWEEGRGRVGAIRELLQAQGYEVAVEQDELLQGTDRYNVYGVRPGYRQNGGRHDAAEASMVVEWEAGLEAGWEVSEVSEYARERLPSYMVPQQWVVLEQLPLTVNGKVDREALPAPAHAGELDHEADGEWTPVEELVAGIWSEVLKLPVVGGDDNFFELGGHSLLATQVISRVREVFGVEVGLRRLFEAPTVRGLSRAIELQLRAGAGLTVPPLERAERERWQGLLPLSFAQQRLWFLDQLEPGTAYYNSFKGLRLQGELDVAALERTLSEIVRRHEVLRTRFVSVGGEPRQEVLAAAAVQLAVTDLSGVAASEREAVVRAAATAASKEPFDLAQGPLLRVQLLRVSEQEQVVLLTMHHIVSDAWSMGVLIREVATLYEAYSKGEESPLAELPVQYGDFAVWQRSWLQGEELERQMGYWRRQLGGGALPVLELPTDRPRPALQSYRGAVQQFKLSAAVTAQLRELSRREGVTMFMTLMAAFQTLLYRYSGQEEIVVGSDVANRNRGETEALIGFFVNQLVLRTDLRGEPTFVELLRRVKEVCLGAYAHQDVPFEKLVEELQPERDLSRSPLFQVKLLLEHPSMERVTLRNVELHSISTGPTAAKLDLTLIFSDLGENLMVSLQYIPDLFNDTTINRMQTHLNAVLESIVKDPDKPVSRISIWDPSSFVDCNKANQNLVTSTTFQELFETQVERSPEAVALVHGAEQLNYRELNARANQLAHYLRKQGVGAEVVVGLCLERSVEMVVALLGVLKAGGAYLPLDPEYPQQRLEYLLADAQVGLVLTEQQLLARLPVHWGRTLVLEEVREAIAQESDENLPSANEAENLAYVIYTSGSTGQPKGVMVTHGGLGNYLQWASTAYPFAAGSGSPLHSTLSFDLTVTTLYAPLLVGGWIDLLSEGSGLEEAWQERSGYGVVKLTPAHLRLLNAGEVSAERLREWSAGVVVGGEALNWEQVRPWVAAGVRVYNEYGPTETVVGSSAYELAAAEAETGGSVSIGRPINNTEMYVLAQWQQPVAIGVRGEIYIGGAGVARGYRERAELTAERFVPHPYSANGGERLYRTGDEGRYLEDGRIEYLGRRDQQVKLRGYRIELGEIEAVLESHAGVQQAVVTVHEESAGNQRLVAYLSGRQDIELNVDEVKLLAIERLPAYMIPQAWMMMMEAFPLTRNGKLDRRALPPPEHYKTKPDEFTEPQTIVQETLANIWAEVLEIEQVDIHENFFDLGGHSLLGAQVISRVRETFNIDMYLRTLFEQPTVAGFATAVEKHLTTEMVDAPKQISRA